MKSTKRETVVVNPEGDITKTQFSKKRTPCFNFFSSDFLVETFMMNYEEKGRYIQLLCILHTQGHLPWRDTAEIIGSESKIWRLLEKDEQGFYFSERLQYEIDKREAYRRSRQENGLKKYEKQEAQKKERDILKEIEELEKKFNNNTSLITQNGESADEPKNTGIYKLIDPFEEKDRLKNAAYAEHMGNGNGNRNVNGNVNENENIDNNRHTEVEKEVLEYCNKKTNSLYSTNTNMSHIIIETYQRGYSVEEMKLIIDYCCAVSITGRDLSPYNILAEDTRDKLKRAHAWREKNEKARK